MMPGEVAWRLAGLVVAETRAQAFSVAATRLASAVKDALSSPWRGDHDPHWLRCGILRNGIGRVVDLDWAVARSNDPAAVLQEIGARANPRRPFLAPVASVLAGRVVRGLAQTIAEGRR